jgi:hypothetical protein
MGWWSAEPSRTGVRAAIGTTVSATVGSAVLDPRNATRATVGRTLGPAVSATVGPAVRATVGPAVRATVGPAISATVGPAVRATVLNTGHAFSAAVRRTIEVVETFAGTVRWFAHRSSV